MSTTSTLEKDIEREIKDVTHVPAKVKMSPKNIFVMVFKISNYELKELAKMMKDKFNMELDSIETGFHRIVLRFSEFDGVHQKTILRPDLIDFHGTIRTVRRRRAFYGAFEIEASDATVEVELGELLDSLTDKELNALQRRINIELEFRK